MARVVHNHAAYEALLKDPAVLADLTRRAEAIATAANAGGGLHVVRFEVGPRRARAAVVAADPAAYRAEARDHNLTRAVDAGRG